MDKSVTVRMFTVEKKEENGLPFSDALRRIGGMPLAQSQRELWRSVVAAPLRE